VANALPFLPRPVTIDPHRVNRKPKKSPREKDLTSRYLSGGLDEDRVDASQRFSSKNKQLQQNKMERTARMRQDVRDAAPDVDKLPVGRVVQVFSLFCEIEHEGVAYLCTIRKTLNSLTIGGIIVGDMVRFRPSGTMHEMGKPEAAVEAVEPRRTVLTRADSFKQIVQHPVVANADQMLIVVSPAQPRVKWGLVDRMLVAAKSGGLEPIICLNKVDLADKVFDDGTPNLGVDTSDEFEGTPPPLEALAYYASIGVRTIRTSVFARTGLVELAGILKEKTTVLAGHSGVGKSSLVTAIQADLDIRVGDVSISTEKGRHTTTSARHYPLRMGGAVVDTPGVKVFGLWDVTADDLEEYFSDIADDSAPAWRRASFERIAESLKGRG
jgi:ribosome biogenesis GTPase